MKYYYYLFPRVGTLPTGYNKTLALHPTSLAHIRPEAGPFDLKMVYRRFFDGKQTHEETRVIKRAADGGWSDEEVVFEYRCGEGINAAQRQESPGFYQLDIETDRPVFTNPFPDTPYAIYWREGRKTFMAELANKFADPRVVRQIQTFGQYLQAYPCTYIDRTRDISSAVTVINPYRRPLLASITTHDGRSLKRQRIDAMSARRLNLIGLLKPDEIRWSGSVQVTSSNRVLTYFLTHRLSDPTYVVDHEHLDFYLTTPTTIAWSAYQVRRAQTLLGRLNLSSIRNKSNPT
jgi:hypothetical protein